MRKDKIAFEFLDKVRNRSGFCYAAVRANTQIKPLKENKYRNKNNYLITSTALVGYTDEHYFSFSTKAKVTKFFCFLLLCLVYSISICRQLCRRYVTFCVNKMLSPVRELISLWSELVAVVINIPQCRLSAKESS